MAAMQIDKLNALILISASSITEDNSRKFKSTSCTVAVPVSLNKKAYDIIHSRNEKSNRSIIKTFTKRIFVAVLIICTILFAFAMSIQAVRNAFWNVITEWFDEYVSIGFQTTVSVPSTIEKKKEPNWLPEKYNKKVLTDGISTYTIGFYKEDTETISYSQHILSGEYALNSEDARCTDVYINNNAGIYMVYDDGYSMLVWSDKEYRYVILSCNAIIDVKAMIEMAESVK